MKIEYEITEEKSSGPSKLSELLTSQAETMQKLSPSKLQAIDRWELDSKLDLNTEIADFYLLYKASLEGKFEETFQAKLEILTEQFVAYTDMVIGGEIRHLSATKSLPKPLYEALAGGESSTIIPKHSRHAAWMGWYQFRLKYGTIAIKWVEDGFKLFKGSSYGGPPWANIAKVLRLYEESQLTPLMFVDTCWGLQHNNGSYFNKVWHPSPMLLHLMNCVRKGDEHELEPHASKECKKLLGITAKGPKGPLGKLLDEVE